jgi:DNA-binding IclR family transcriptional regulator
MAKATATKIDYSDRTAELTLSLLELVATNEKQRFSATSLGAILSINRNKAFRLITTLEKRGFLERDEVSGAYKIGFVAVALSQIILKNSSIIDRAHPVMEALVKKHDEAVYMTVANGEELLFLDMVECTQKVRTASLIGQRFPLFSNAAGKLIKACESADVDRLRKQPGLKSPQLDINALISELTDIRRIGVAIDCGGFGEGVVTVAVAVRDYAGKIVGALTMLAPSFRMLADRLENEVVPSLLEGAEALSASFGYAPLCEA